MPPKEALRDAIEVLLRGVPNLTSAELRKLASLRMNLRILEELSAARAMEQPGGAPLEAGDSKGTRRPDG